MKRKFFSIFIALVLVLSFSLVTAGPVSAAKPNGCTRIQDGVLTYSAGHYLADQLLQVGYDIFGYNYQAHQFKGSYANVYLGRDGFPPYEGDAEAYLEANPDAENKWYWPHRDVQLVMKWSDIWLSNKDCDSDGKLDRGGATEGAWETNHQRGTDEGVNWTYYIKIVCPLGGVVDVNNDDIDDNTGAPTIWGGYIILQEVSSSEGATNHAQPVGFGAYK